jgi:hypothetical protein
MGLINFINNSDIDHIAHILSPMTINYAVYGVEFRTQIFFGLKLNHIAVNGNECSGHLLPPS